MNNYEYKRCLNCGYETEYASEIDYCYTCEQAYHKGFNKAKEESK